MSTKLEQYLKQKLTLLEKRFKKYRANVERQLIITRKDIEKLKKHYNELLQKVIFLECDPVEDT